MPASPLDSALYRDLLGDPEVGGLFTDTAEVRAMLVVEGALARVQGGLGLIPEASAALIHRASLEVQIDAAALAPATAVNGVPVPALVAAFRREMAAPAHAAFVHWGATSQDIMDTALMLRLRQALAIMEARLAAVIRALGGLAAEHADVPMAGRTYGQAAVPTGFGAVAAGWGGPLMRHHARLADLRPRLLNVSLSGAAGTLGAMSGQGPAVRAALAGALGLGDPGGSWHAARDGVGELCAWLTLVTTALGKMGEDLLLLTQSSVAEVRLGGAGGSSTMPQKQNPVAPSLLVALARAVIGFNAAMQSAGLHRQQRDGAAWFTEWLVLPQMVVATARALSVAGALLPGLSLDRARMAAGLDPDGLGLIHAEALTFALARRMPRPEAEAEVKALCALARDSGRSLAALAADRWPDAAWAALLDPAAQLGTAPVEARDFAEAAAVL